MSTLVKLAGVGFLVLGLALLLPTGTGYSGETDDLPLSCTISSARSTCRLGERPVITVRLTNRTGREIYLLPALDASDYQWRYPLCYFTVIGPDGKSAVKEPPPRCGNIDILQGDVFVRVPPGKSFDPYQRLGTLQPSPAHQLAGNNFQQEGEHLIRFIYSTAQPKLQPWLGDLRPEEGVKLAALLKRVPKATITSNEIRIKVVRPR